MVENQSMYIIIDLVIICVVLSKIIDQFAFRNYMAILNTHQQVVSLIKQRIKVYYFLH